MIMETMKNQHPDQKKLQDLEKKLTVVQRELALLTKRVNYLERENSRRKSDINQIVNAIKK